MKKGTLIAAIATPLACAAAGVMIARITNANADDAQGYCAEPTVYVDMADGVSMVTGDAAADASCDGPSCTVTGAEQVEINADGQVQCIDLNAGQALSLTRRGEGVSVRVEDLAAR